MSVSTASPPQTRYAYKPLGGTDEIRLIQLYPELDLLSPHVRCSIHHVQLANAPPYEALSYFWGAPEKDFTISCENQAYVPVTKSLHTALCDLRNPTQKAYSWTKDTVTDFRDPENTQLFWADYGKPLRPSGKCTFF